jgi:hypothetical protein
MDYELLETQEESNRKRRRKITDKLDELGVCHVNGFDKLERALIKLAAAVNPSPDYRQPLARYGSFNWQSIDAVVMNSDGGGPTFVKWGGLVYTRRCKVDQRFGSAIWYSKSAGKNGDGENKYHTLIKFTDKISPPAAVPSEILRKAGKK